MLEQMTMSDREEKSLLPTSSVTTGKVKQRAFPLKRAFCWLHLLTITFLVCWLTFLTLKCWSSEAKALLPEEIIRHFITNQEVKKLSPSTS